LGFHSQLALYQSNQETLMADPPPVIVWIVQTGPQNTWWSIHKTKEGAEGELERMIKGAVPDDDPFKRRHWIGENRAEVVSWDLEE
jgi:hypothetical protein